MASQKTEPPAPRAAIVTGAAMGIGRAVARRLAADGCRVLVNDLPANVAALDALVAEIEAAHGGEAGAPRAVAFPADVSEEENVKALVEKAVEVFGGLDVMVANAGTSEVMPLLKTSLAEIDRLWKINYHSVFLSYKYAAEQMIKQGRGGRIIGASSAQGKKGAAFMGAYGSTKFAIRGLTQTAAQEFGAYSITVNAYCPGAIVTPLNDRLGEESGELMKAIIGGDGGFDYKEIYANTCALRRVGNVDDVAGLVSFLASKDSAFITGQNILVDGGVLFD